jgi:subtilisin family serine protease
MIKIAVTIYLGMLLAAVGIANAADPIKVAIIDTGLDFNNSTFKVCPNHTGWNFVTDKPKPNDENGHGTHIAGLITTYAKDAPHCLLIYKYYRDGASGSVNLTNIVKAIYQAVKDGAQIVNYSGGGPVFDEREYLAIQSAPKVLFVVAAGNHNEDISNIENYYYPASYRLPNIVAVGAKAADGEKLPSSNYNTQGGIFWEPGENVRSTLPGGRYGYMSGTSMSTAIHTGKRVYNLFKTGKLK